MVLAEHLSNLRERNPHINYTDVTDDEIAAMTKYPDWSDLIKLRRIFHKFYYGGTGYLKEVATDRHPQKRSKTVNARDNKSKEVDKQPLNAKGCKQKR